MRKLLFFVLFFTSFASFALDLSLLTDNQNIKEALSKSLTEKEVITRFGKPDKKEKEYYNYSIFNFKYDLTLKFKNGKTIFVSYSPRKEKRYLRNFPEDIRKKASPSKGKIPHDDGRYITSRYKNYHLTFKNIASKPLYKVEVQFP